MPDDADQSALPSTQRLVGPLGKTVVRNRRAIERIAASHGASNVQVFGSVARAQETASSDVDLLVNLAPETGLLGIGRLERDLSALLGARVDVVPRAALKAEVAHEVLNEAVTLGARRCDPLVRVPGREPTV